MNLLINVDDLAASDDIRVFDCRFSLMDKTAGRSDYDVAHIPGALHADLEADLSSAPGEAGRHPLPDKDTLVTKLRAWGINNDSTIVCYDQNAGAFAARLWWLLRWLGHEHVAVLDGGLDAWLAAGQATTGEVPAFPAGDIQARATLTRTVAASQVLNAGNRLIDAREAARFNGEVEPIDPVAGHIPGAQCATFTDNLSHGRFRPPAELKARFEAMGIGLNDPLVCYCGSGVTATHNILALLLAGYPEPALYPDSWSGWITDPSRPVATGP